MAIAIVDAFEMVDIENHVAERRLVSAPARHFLHDTLVVSHPAVNPGEGIVHQLVSVLLEHDLQFLGFLFHLGQLLRQLDIALLGGFVTLVEAVDEVVDTATYFFDVLRNSCLQFLQIAAGLEVLLYQAHAFLNEVMQGLGILVIGLVVAVILGDDLGNFAELLGNIDDETFEFAFFLVEFLD